MVSHRVQKATKACASIFCLYSAVHQDHSSSLGSCRLNSFSTWENTRCVNALFLALTKTKALNTSIQWGVITLLRDILTYPVLPEPGLHCGIAAKFPLALYTWHKRQTTRQTLQAKHFLRTPCLFKNKLISWKRETHSVGRRKRIMVQGVCEFSTSK